MSSPIRVAIVGGGCGGIAAAFWLTAPELNGKYEVTVYTQGWRLGGKGASGRAAEGDRRIEEHGLHLWLGCYNRAFQMMRLCYAEQGSPKPFNELADAFIPMSTLALGPPGGGTGGDKAPQWRLSCPVSGAFPGRGPSSVPGALLDRLRGVIGSLASWRGTPEKRPGSSMGDRLSQAAILTDLASAFARGLITDLWLGPGTFDDRIAALEDEDFRTWLRRHGAGPATRDSALVRSIYDLAFAYPNGDCDRPGELAAGSTVGLILELLCYRGAPLFKMASAMGDTIFAPLYRVLEARGVGFAFFHHLRSVATDSEQTRLTAMTLEKQAELANSRYEPLIEVDGRECWPNQPLWDQLKDGDALRARGACFEDSRRPEAARTIDLVCGRDFDLAILAVPPDVLKSTTVAFKHPRWRDMLGNSASVATQACQLWLRGSAEDEGWDRSGLVSALQPPLSTWADMSHLLEYETWDGPAAPKSVHYLCGPLTDTAATSGHPEAVVEAGMLAWLEDGCGAVRDDDIGVPVKDVVQSMARANVHGSDRYVQAPPGSIHHRLAPDSRLYENLFLAGDWTRTRYSGGCVENAVQSGLTVARAISGRANLGGDGAQWP